MCSCIVSPMSAPVSASAPAEAAATAPAAPRATHGSRTPLLALPEARWAAAATVAFLLALPLQLLGTTAWLWGPLYAVAYVAGGWKPGLEGLRALREKTLDVDLLMVVAALGAAAIGQVMDGALLVVIFATSGALEALATARTEDSVRGLLDLAPATATRLTADGSEETVPASELAIDDVLLIRPGERVGADARVVDGASDVDQATITGEPLPVPKTVGDEVFMRHPQRHRRAARPRRPRPLRHGHRPHRRPGRGGHPHQGADPAVHRARRAALRARHGRRDPRGLPGPAGLR